MNPKQNTKFNRYVILNSYGHIWTPEIFHTEKEAYEYLNQNPLKDGLQKHTVAEVQVKLKLI